MFLDTNGLRMQLYNRNSSNPSAQRFTFQKNANGTFTILTNVSNNTKCIDGQPEVENSTADGSPIQQQTVVEGDAGQQWYFIEVKTNLATGRFMQSSATYTADGNYLTGVTDSLGHTTSYVTDPGGERYLLYPIIYPDGH